ncbi:MAG: rhodanese-like domain-containing protein, partial [Gemmatimonadaceae bacterium]
GTREITALMDYDALCGVSPSGSLNGDEHAVEEDVASGEITPQRLHARIKAGDSITVLDVRETYEWAIARLPDARLIPLGSLPRAVNSLDRTAEIVAYCHHGTRSAAAVAWLQDQGFAKVLNLVGGIDRWSLEVDNTVRRY